MLRRNGVVLDVLIVCLTAGCGAASAPAVDPDADADPEDAPPHEDVVFTLTTTPFVLAPGAEAQKCQAFANPIGHDVDVVAIESAMPRGAHHMQVLLQPAVSDSEPYDCPVQSGDKLYSAQLADNQLVFPPGIAARVPADRGLVVTAHYLNSTDQPLTISVEITFHLASPGTVTDRAGYLRFGTFDIHIPSSDEPTAVRFSCPVPFDANLLFLSGHMHAHGIDLRAESAGTTLYRMDSWFEAPWTWFDPPLPVRAGQMIDTTCVYRNDSGAPITYGESAERDEMCVVSALYYPVPPGRSPDAACSP